MKNCRKIKIFFTCLFAWGGIGRVGVADMQKVGRLRMSEGYR